MSRIRVRHLQSPGRPNPVWELDDTEGTEYLKILKRLSCAFEGKHECCGSGTFVVTVFEDGVVGGRQVVSRRTIVSWSASADDGVTFRGDDQGSVSCYLLSTKPAVFTTPLRSDDATGLGAFTWPTCACGSAERFRRWAQGEALQLNCYSFAVNHSHGAARDAAPGRKGCGHCDPTYAPTTTDALVCGAVADGLHQIQALSWPPPDRHHYAALLVDPDEQADFHWTRLESDLLWAHKWPDCPPHFCDDRDRLVRFDSRSPNGGVAAGDYGVFKFVALFLVPDATIVC